MPSLKVTAVVTQPDRPAGRGGKITPPPVKELATRNGIPVLQPTSLKRELPTILEQLKELGPFDVGVVIAFGQILPREILELPRCGCINIHASLLPRWRGAAPIQRAIAAGDPETGVCLMQMDEGLDTGHVFCEHRVPIKLQDTTATLHDTLARAGADLLASKLEDIVTGALRASPQPTDGVTYATKITTEECKLDWKKGANELSLLIRAFTPYPGCFSFWRGKRLKFHYARALTSSSASEPGTVTAASSGRLEIRCGTGALTIEELQLEGKKRMTTEEFLRGTGLTEGEVLTS
jgi:methionyl-tRNA formyltransferase